MFVQGERIVCHDATGEPALERGRVYTFSGYWGDIRTKPMVQVAECHPTARFFAHRFSRYDEKAAGAQKPAEFDPSGLSANQPGAKLDAGKVQPALVIEGMPRAVWAVAAVATFGAAKYTPNGWVSVPNGETRYANAGYRHVLKRAMGEDVDPDSELSHLAHEAWNALAKLELHIRNREGVPA